MTIRKNVDKLFLQEKDFDGFDLIKGNKKVSVVYFVADWNSLATRLMDNVEELIQDKHKILNYIEIFFIDIDREEYLLDVFNVNSVPNMITFENGQLSNKCSYKSGAPDVYSMIQEISIKFNIDYEYDNNSRY